MPWGWKRFSETRLRRDMGGGDPVVLYPIQQVSRCAMGTIVVPMIADGAYGCDAGARFGEEDGAALIRTHLSVRNVVDLTALPGEVPKCATAPSSRVTLDVTRTLRHTSRIHKAVGFVVDPGLKLGHVQDAERPRLPLPVLPPLRGDGPEPRPLGRFRPRPGPRVAAARGLVHARGH